MSIQKPHRQDLQPHKGYFFCYTFPPEVECLVQLIQDRLHLPIALPMESEAHEVLERTFPIALQRAVFALCSSMRTADGTRHLELLYQRGSLVNELQLTDH